MAASTPHLFGSEQQWLATLAVDGLTETIIFDKFSGGDVVTTANKHRPGGMGPEITYTSLPVFSDVTVSKVYETQVDHAKIAVLHQLAGRAAATVTLQPLDESGAAWGSARVYQGRLLSIKDGGTDSNSNAPRMFEVDIVVENITG